MYDELVKRLRTMADWVGISFLEDSENVRTNLSEAADAIEELSMKLHGDEAAIAGMKREIERMVVFGNKPRWIPCDERLPENGKYVLAYSADDDYTTVEARHKFEAFQITHWQPLPEPPEEGKS